MAPAHLWAPDTRNEQREIPCTLEFIMFTVFERSSCCHGTHLLIGSTRLTREAGWVQIHPLGHTLRCWIDSKAHSDADGPWCSAGDVECTHSNGAVRGCVWGFRQCRENEMQKKKRTAAPRSSTREALKKGGCAASEYRASTRMVTGSPLATHTGASTPRSRLIPPTTQRLGWVGCLDKPMKPKSQAPSLLVFELYEYSNTSYELIRDTFSGRHAVFRHACAGGGDACGGSGGCIFVALARWQRFCRLRPCRPHPAARKECICVHAHR
jgi:hypothetical protein